MYTSDYSFIASIEDWETQKAVMRELCLRDLFFLCRYVLGYVDMETTTDIHLRQCAELNYVERKTTLERLNMIEQPAHLRYLDLAFRGSFKTSIALGKVIQWLIRDSAAQIGIGSDTAERAEKRTRDLRDVIAHNTLLKELFPDVFYGDPKSQADLWTTTEFNIKRPPRDDRMGGFGMPSVSAFGLFPMPTGAHFTHVWLDDVENDDNCDNPEQIEKLVRNVGLFIPIPQPEAPILMTGTIYSEDGPNTVYQKRWKTYVCPIVDRHNQPTFPKKFPQETIEQIRKDITDEWTWLGQYMLRPSKRTDKFFFPFSHQRFHAFERWGNDYLKHETDVVRLLDCLVYATVDPGGGADETTATAKIDKVGWCVNAVDVRGRWHILELQRKYLNDDQFIDLLISLNDRYGAYLIAYEKMPHLESIVRMKLVERGRSLPLTHLTPRKRNKSDRIRALNPLWNNIYFADDLDCMQHIRGWYTDQEHDDDDIDAMAYQIDVARAPTPQQLQAQKLRRVQQDDKQALERLPAAEQMEWKHWLKVHHDQQQPGVLVEEEWKSELADFWN